MTSQSVPTDAQVNLGDVPPPDVGGKERVKLRPTEGDVRRVRQHVCFPIVDEDRYSFLRSDFVDPRRRVATHVQVSRSVERQAVGQALRSLHVDTALARRAVGFELDTLYTREPRAAKVDRAIRADCDAVGEIERTRVPHAAVAVTVELQDSPGHFAEVTTVGDK